MRVCELGGISLPPLPRSAGPCIFCTIQRGGGHGRARRRQERWLSGRKRRFAKPVRGLHPSTGSNPVLSALALLRYAHHTMPDEGEEKKPAPGGARVRVGGTEFATPGPGSDRPGICIGEPNSGSSSSSVAVLRMGLPESVRNRSLGKRFRPRTRATTMPARAGTRASSVPAPICVTRCRLRGRQPTYCNRRAKTRDDDNVPRSSH